MRRLNAPDFSPESALSKCKMGVGINAFRRRVEAAVEELSHIADLYKDQGSNGSLYTVPALPKGTNENEIVAGGLTKKELIKLYETYLRDPDKPGRVIYDVLLLAANGRCPFCGGIGRPRNLDHFLPKAFFPQFSVVPLNLVPSCRDCNMDGKAQAYARTGSDQFIHPYLDEDHFFTEQWIYAQLVPGDPCAVEYFVSAPDGWSKCDQERVAVHFQSFDIDSRYSVQAAEEISVVVDQRRGFLRCFHSEDFSEYLASFTKAPLFANHWKRVLYQCLAESDWFCSAEL